MVECEIDGIGTIVSPIVEALSAANAISARRMGKLEGCTCIVTGGARGKSLRNFYVVMCGTLHYGVLKSFMLASFSTSDTPKFAAWIDIRDWIRYCSSSWHGGCQKCDVD